MSRVVKLKDRSPRWLKDVANAGTRTFGVVTADLRPLPDFLITGTKRGGTTSLFNYLLQHPGVLGLYPQPRGLKSTDFFFREGLNDLRWYRSHFHTLTYRRVRQRRTGYLPVTGEASPYYMWDPRIPEMVRAVRPGMKAIALLRDPVMRAWSHYQERVHNGVEPLNFEQALEAEDDRISGELERMRSDPRYYGAAYDWYSYRSRGVYLPQLTNWLKSFPPEQLLVLRSEDMYLDPQRTVDQVSTFLGIPPTRIPGTKAYNAITRGNVPEGAAEGLREFYREHNASLEQFLGRPLGW